MMQPLRWRRVVPPALALLVALLLAPPAGAHALGAECKVIGDRVALEAYYDDDTPARDATVRVEDADKNVVATGHTDREGRWSFARPQPGKYVVVVDAGAGHRTHLNVTIPAEEAPAASAPASPGDACPYGADPSNTSAATHTTVVSDGPSRQEFTAFPLIKLGIGLVVIGGVAVAFLLSRRIGGAAVGK